MDLWQLFQYVPRNLLHVILHSCLLEAAIYLKLSCVALSYTEGKI